jgi:hypothetical protein
VELGKLAGHLGVVIACVLGFVGLVCHGSLLGVERSDGSGAAGDVGGSHNATLRGRLPRPDVKLEYRTQQNGTLVLVVKRNAHDYRHERRHKLRFHVDTKRRNGDPLNRSGPVHLLPVEILENVFVRRLR